MRLDPLDLVLCQLVRALLWIVVKLWRDGSDSGDEGTVTLFAGFVGIVGARLQLRERLRSVDEATALELLVLSLDYLMCFLIGSQ